MNREIKYRGYSKEQDRWIYGDLVHHGFTAYNKIEHYTIKKPHHYPIKVESESIGEYTGQKDKNGKDIYEGDVLHIENGEDENSKTEYVTVYCKYENFMFQLLDSSTGNWNKVLIHKPYRLQVIGNIFENPHLLKKVKP